MGSDSGPPNVRPDILPPWASLLWPLVHRALFTRWWTVLPQKLTCTARGASLSITAGAGWRLPEVLGFIVSQIRT